MSAFYTLGHKNERCDYPKCTQQADFIMPGMGYVVYLCSYCLRQTYEEYNNLFDRIQGSVKREDDKD